MWNKLFILFLCISCLSACEKEYEVDNAIPEFKGITFRTNSGAIAPNTFSDNTDWKLVDNWNLTEKNLFPKVYNFDYICSTVNDDFKLFEISAYPNPCPGIFTLHFDRLDYWNINIQVVDQQFKVLHSIYRSAFGFPWKSVEIDVSNRVNEIVRVYYVLSISDCVYYGHGDILVN